jgi:MurNAc alpha-1-phosphate uridylyltransferase
MKAMILAAGLGKRMRPLTEHTPKPLLKIGTRYLIEFHLEKLAKAGIKEVVINTHWLAEQIPAALGNGERWGLQIHYSHEPELLETAGGIRECLHLLASAPEDVFLLINGDVYFEWDLAAWIASAPMLDQQHPVFLALVQNPSHHPHGDFGILKNVGISKNVGFSKDLDLSKSEACLVSRDSASDTYTYAGIGLYRASFFEHLAKGYHALGPMLKAGLEQRAILGRLEDAYWLDVGSPERLEALRSRLAE